MTNVVHSHWWTSHSLLYLPCTVGFVEGIPFVLDRVENPHPDMLGDALRTRARARNRPWDPETAAEWRGYLRAMCFATGCEPAEIEGWMDRNAPKVGV